MRQLSARLVAWIRKYKVFSQVVVVAGLFVAVAALARDYWDIRAPGLNPNSRPSTSSASTPGSSSSTATVSATTPASSTPTASTPGSSTASHAPPDGTANTVTRTSSAPDPSDVDTLRIFNEFTIEVQPGYGYDLDIARNQDTYTNFGWSADDAGYSYRDLYRTRTGDDILMGVQQPVTANNHNRVILVDRNDSPERCRTLAISGGGNVALQAVTVGSKICVYTRAGRWAMVKITSMPATRQSNLGIQVTVLAE